MLSVTIKLTNTCLLAMSVRQEKSVRIRQKSFFKVTKIRHIVLGFLLLTWNRFFCLIFIKDFFNPFHTAGLFYTQSKNKSFSDVLRGTERD